MKWQKGVHTHIIKLQKKKETLINHTSSVEEMKPTETDKTEERVESKQNSNL